MIFIFFAGYLTAKIDIVFIIDSATYLGKENFKIVKEFIKSVVKYFRIAPSFVRVGAITYSTMVNDNINLNTYSDLRKVLHAIDKIPVMTGAEYTGRAIYYARQYSFTQKFGYRQDVTNVAVFITDGKSKDAYWSSVQDKLLQEKDVKVFVVAVGNINMKGEESLASIPYKWFILRVPNYKVLGRYDWALASRIYWGKYLNYTVLEQQLVVF